MRTAIRMIAALAMGVSLLLPLAALYGAANLPVYHSWGLSHGSFTTALPALVAASYVALGLVPKLGPSIDMAPRLVASACVIILVTVLFWVDQHAEYATSVWHYVTYIALLGVFVALALKARRPWSLPLFLLVPLLADPVFGLFITGPTESTSLQIFAHELTRKLLPAAVASGLAVGLAGFLRRSEA